MILRILVAIQQVGRELPKVSRNGTTPLSYKQSISPQPWHQKMGNHMAWLKHSHFWKIKTGGMLHSCIWKFLQVESEKKCHTLRGVHLWCSCMSHCSGFAAFQFRGNTGCRYGRTIYCAQTQQTISSTVGISGLQVSWVIYFLLDTSNLFECSQLPFTSSVPWSIYLAAALKSSRQELELPEDAKNWNWNISLYALPPLLLTW